MPLETSYTSQSAGSASNTVDTASKPVAYWELSKLRKCYTDYLFSKREELDEQIDARRYYHGSQWTTEQIRTMKRRKQPVMTFNRIARKIDGVCGLIEKLRQDPKAYARTPQHEEGAELATAALRYVLDDQEWKAKSPQAAQDGAIDGIGGIELEIEDGQNGDKEIGFELVDVQSFFYDPRSYKMDFSDARYMGIGKWLDEDIAREMFPDAGDDAFQADDELVGDADKERRWFSTDGVTNRVRIVDIWYKHKGGWCWAIFSGNAILMEGKSYFQDDKDEDYCKYIMFSGNVDHDGDRYGFVRNMKSAQDGINARQSKMQHILASRRLIISQGAVDDIEKVRREWARPDGVVVTNRTVNEGVKADDQSFDFAGWTKMLELNLAEIEGFGPNPQLLGQTTESGQSGRAIALLQQAGMAELGPYILAFRGWKLRVYRALYNAVQKHWNAERWIRVTDDDGIAQYVQINGMQMDENGQPTMVNAIGQLDVDIILDEAPDAVTIQGQSFEFLQALGPQFIQQHADIAIELSPLDAATKKKIRDKQAQAAQAQEPVQQIQMANATEEVKNLAADTQLKEAQAVKAMKEANEPAPADTKMMEAEAKIAMEREKHAMEMRMMAEKAEHERIARDGELRKQQIEIAHASSRVQHESRMASTAEQDASERLNLTRAKTAKTKQDAANSQAEQRSKQSESSNRSSTDAMSATALAAVAGALNKIAGPKKIIRGKDGRAEGVE
jgi:hypothetical protein